MFVAIVMDDLPQIGDVSANNEVDGSSIDTPATTSALHPTDNSLPSAGPETELPTPIDSAASTAEPHTASTSTSEPPSASTGSEQSNVVSTDSQLGFRSSTFSTTEEAVSRFARRLNGYFFCGYNEN